MATAEVLHAKDLASQMLRWESRGPGDTDNAMRRVATRHDIEYGALWSLRYRSPKRIWADVANKIADAYEKERQRQLRKLAHEAELTEAVTGSGSHSVEAARTLLRQAAGASPEVAEAQAADLSRKRERRRA